MHLKAKLYLVDDDAQKFMGAGVLWLLEKIESEGSLRKASKALNLSYSKSHNMIANLEKQLSKDILVRAKGGFDHKGSSLTPFALSFISLYREYQDEAKKSLGKSFNEFEIKLNKLLEE